MVGKVAQVVLETTTELRSELVTNERRSLFEETDRVCDTRIFLPGIQPLGYFNDDFLDFFGPVLARVRQVEVLLPQDTECSHESAARCGKDVISGLCGRGVGIKFERFDLVRLAALTQADLIRPLDSNVRQLRKGGFRKLQALVVATTDQVPGHVCSHATRDRYRETITVTIRTCRLSLSTSLLLPTLPLPQIPHVIPRAPISPSPQKPRNSNDHISNLEGSGRELRAELEERRRAGRTTSIGSGTSSGHTVERMRTAERMATNGPRRGQ